MTAMTMTQTQPRWLAPFLVFAIVVQGVLTIHYYRTESIGSAVAGVLIIILLLLALWGATNDS